METGSTLIDEPKQHLRDRGFAPGLYRNRKREIAPSMQVIQSH